MLLLDLICMFMGREPCVWRSGDDLEELVLSYCVGTRDQTQVIRFGSKRFQSLSRLKESQFFTLIISTKSYMTGDLTFGGYELTLRIPDCLKQLDKITLSSIQTISFHFPNSPMTHRIFLNYRVRFRECQ